MFDFLQSQSNNKAITVEVEDSVFVKTNKTSSDIFPLIGSIDQGTSSTRFMTFTSKGQVAAWAQMEHQQIFPDGEDKVCN